MKYTRHKKKLNKCIIMLILVLKKKILKIVILEINNNVKTGNTLLIKTSSIKYYNLLFVFII